MTRRALSVTSVLVAASAVLGEGYYRRYESHAGGDLVHYALGGWTRNVANKPDFYFIMNHHAMGLRLSYGCSTSMLVFAILLAAAACLMGKRAGTGRVVIAAAVAVAVLFATNMLRMMIIALFVGRWGEVVGFGWGHTVVGSLVVLFGITAAFFLFLRIIRTSPLPTPSAV